MQQVQKKSPTGAILHLINTRAHARTQGACKDFKPDNLERNGEHCARTYLHHVLLNGFANAFVA